MHQSNVLCLTPPPVRPRSRSRDSGDENDNIQERHFRPHFLQAPGDLIVQEGRLCRMDCKVNGGLAALQPAPTRPLKELLIRKTELWCSADEVHRFLFSELKTSELCFCWSMIHGRSGFGVFAQL